MIKFPRHVFNENKLEDGLIIKRRSIRFYIDAEYLTPKIQIEINMMNNYIDCSDINLCIFCGFLRRLDEVTLNFDDDFVYFTNEKFKLDSKICFEGINPLCEKNNYNLQSEEYLVKVYGEDLAAKKIHHRKHKIKGRYTKPWFINKYGEDIGIIKYNERSAKLSKSSTKEGFIEKHGLEDGTIRWDKFINSLKIKRDLDFYISRFGVTIGSKKYKAQIDHIRSLNDKQTFVDKYGDDYANDLWGSRYANLECYVRKYGEVDGPIKYKDYCERKNINLENLQTKYGEDGGILKFDEFKEKSKVTLESMIDRYGEELGTKRYNDWREKLKGKCTLGWYIERYGEEEGSMRYKEFCTSSAVTLSRMINKYGEIEGTEKYISWVEKITSINTYSAISQRLFYSIYDHVGSHNIYFHTLNEEYHVMDKVNLKNYFIDFVDMTTNKVIEFNGDFWHANPKIYDESFINPMTNRSASYIWIYDKIRNDFIQSLGFDVLVVWESDYVKNPEKTLNQCLEYLGAPNV
jgi:very-short-patch-repair endonuclease